ncbi:hypothetical protein BX600DRAFT_452324 [Xylariales sp. PMI_506]|nr:hypothetical protein BX600DRAFT_452324 [Xylariales sp. PMI_506]
MSILPLLFASSAAAIRARPRCVIPAVQAGVHPNQTRWRSGERPYCFPTVLFVIAQYHSVIPHDCVKVMVSSCTQ